MWYGEYSHTLDEKDRFILPSKFREKLKTLKQKNLYMTRGLDGCLFILAQEAWQKLETKLKELSFTKQQSRSFNRLLFSGASEIITDSQGRITVPVYLKDFAEIKREIVIIGVADRIEVWNKDHWKQFYANKKEKFEDMAEDLFES